MGKLSLAERLKLVLQGEPLRAITYGATAVAWLAAQVGFAAGVTNVEPPSFEAVTIAVIAAIASITELARRYVYSPVTVDRIVTEAIRIGQAPAEAPQDVDVPGADSPRYPA